MRTADVSLEMSRAARHRARPSSAVDDWTAAGMHSIAGMDGYTASKHAVRGFTKSAALELAGQGVPVNSVHFEDVDMPVTQMAAIPHFCIDDRLLTRAADLSEISALIVYLIGYELFFSTVAEFIADGGITAGAFC